MGMLFQVLEFNFALKRLHSFSQICYNDEKYPINQQQVKVQVSSDLLQVIPEQIAWSQFEKQLSDTILLSL